MKESLIERRDRQSPTTTLGDLAKRGVDIFCWCNRCGHNATLGTERLLSELGPQTGVPEIGCRLRCSGCGSKDVATRPAWPSLGRVAAHDHQ